MKEGVDIGREQLRVLRLVGRVKSGGGWKEIGNSGR